MKVSVVIPAYNEKEGLEPTIKEMPDIVDEIIVVDDGSSDGTYKIAKKLGVVVCQHEINMGKVAAIKTGIDKASGDIIVLTDADYTYPAENITDFVEEINKGADLAIGSRFFGGVGVQNITRFNRMGNKIFSFIATYVSGQYISDAQSGFRAFRKDFLKILGVEAKSLEFETEMTVKAAKHGYMVKEIPIDYRKRLGKSKLNPIIDGLKMSKALIAVLYKETSMLGKMVIMPSIISIVIGIVFGMISLLDFYWYGAPRPFYPILTTLLILVGVQLFSVGLLIDNLTKKLNRIDEKVSHMRYR